MKTTIRTLAVLVCLVLSAQKLSAQNMSTAEVEKLLPYSWVGDSAFAGKQKLPKPEDSDKDLIIYKKDHTAISLHDDDPEQIGTWSYNEKSGEISIVYRDESQPLKLKIISLTEKAMVLELRSSDFEGTVLMYASHAAKQDQ